MKAYTDLNQSKKLAEILPIESADMYYSDVPVREWVDITNISKGTHVIFESQIFAIENLYNHEIGEGDVYAWSLAALLDILPKYIGDSVLRMDMSKNDFSLWFDDLTGIVDILLPDITKGNPIDACYEMILKLNEQKLL